MTPAVIFLNGPPRAGKDTLANHLCRVLPGFRNVKLSAVLKERTHALYGMPYAPHDAFEAVKGEPHPEFMGLTPRQAYINVSEMLFKPAHGADVFGRILAEYMEAAAEGALLPGFVVSDSGFAAEAAPIVERFGAVNCQLVRIHAEGRGCSFAGDSRSFIELPGVRTADLHNDAPDPAGFLSRGAWLVRDFLEGRADA